jgi:hypothetical protein
MINVRCPGLWGLICVVECHGERGTEMITMVGSHHDDGLDIDRVLPVLDDEA